MSINKKFEAMLYETYPPLVAKAIGAAYAQNPVRGLRLNRLKKINQPFNVKPSPLNEHVVISDDYAKTVTHPFHHGGAYYIQDPSATTPVLALQLGPTDIVLDLCAAPGGKSTYILNEIAEGFLVSNDIDFKRNQKLVHNFDRWGHENSVVIQNDGNTIAKALPNTFDKVLLDAPCSGEGLYRRDREFAKTYNPETAHRFALLQDELIENAFAVIKDGGVIVYATCTLNTIENEAVVARFLSNHPSCVLEDTGLQGGMSGFAGLDLCHRYIPDEHGEGHFVARIRVHKPDTKPNDLVFKPFKQQTLELDGHQFVGNFKTSGDSIYGLKQRGFFKTSLSVTRDGVLMGRSKKSHFEFEHALAQSVAFYDSFKHVSVSKEDAYRYLHGQQIETSVRGLFCVDYQNVSLGFAKGTGNLANNRYPKGLRNKFERYESVSLVE